MNRCFVCDRKLGRNPWLVTCADEQDVFVGSECYKDIKAAGVIGYQPTNGGPRLYTLAFDPKGQPSFNDIGRRLDAKRSGAR